MVGIGEVGFHVGALLVAV